ncbi:MAG: hypothetical protein Q9166_000478 [cf. Caloplaca sp. 2 TL-2023]
MFTFDTVCLPHAEVVDYDDPTHGYVNYVDQATADSQDLYNVSNGQVTWGVDHASVASGRGRNSIRLTSKTQYTHGLVILDVAHMPGSICGVWPAFWMTGPNWPNSGEIDIIEGVNTGTRNQMTMHTGPGCTLAGSSCQGGLGCPIKPTEQANNYGTSLNNGGGGVYAMEWTSGSIKIWYFPRNNGLPSDIFSANPNPVGWGTATASFVGGDDCEIDQHFMNNNIVFDTTFCGDWAGAVWSQDGTCSALAGTCQDYVQNHPEAFAEAYWTVNLLKVYQDNGNTVPAAPEKINIPLDPTGTTIATSTQVDNTEPTSSAADKETVTIKDTPMYSATTVVAAGNGNWNFYASNSKAATATLSVTTTAVSIVASGKTSSTLITATASADSASPSAASSDPSFSTCNTPGQSVCSPDGTKIGLCDQNLTVYLGAVAPGTKCVDGGLVGVAAAGRKRNADKGSDGENGTTNNNNNNTEDDTLMEINTILSASSPPKVEERKVSRHLHRHLHNLHRS